MIKDIIKATKRRVFASQIMRSYRLRQEYQQWLKAGRPVPPANLYKHMVVREYAKKFKLRVFVESGTYLGEMISAVQKVFDKIYSIELDQALYEKAKAKFAGKKRIVIFQGDSANVMPSVLALIDRPSLIWLDGHWSGGFTTKGVLNTPIRGELRHIFAHSVRGHVILIDDARCFTGKDDYPTLDELRDLVHSAGSHRRFEVKDDIIRIC